MSVSVLIPYREDGAERKRIFEWVVERYRSLYPQFEICVGTNDDDLFSRSAARNDAYKKSTGDILIINDADTFCNTEYLDAAIRKLSEPNPTWVLPYMRYFNTTAYGAEQILRQDPERDFTEDEIDIEITVDAKNHPPDGSVAGVLVVPAEAFEMVGGYDEKFIGWGYEDDAISLALDTLWGKRERIDGFCVHLWHPPAVDGDFQNPHLRANQMRWNNYRYSIGKASRMRSARET